VQEASARAAVAAGSLTAAGDPAADGPADTIDGPEIKAEGLEAAVVTLERLAGLVAHNASKDVVPDVTPGLKVGAALCTPGAGANPKLAWLVAPCLMW
jgi:hypothetical protein